MTKQMDVLDMIKFSDKEPTRFSNALVFISQEEAIGSLMDMIKNLDVTDFNENDLENLVLLGEALSVKLSPSIESSKEGIVCDKIFDDSTCESIDSFFMASIYNKFLKNAINKDCGESSSKLKSDNEKD